MSGYRGRAGPNFSQFLNDLNTVSATHDDDQFNAEDINLDDDLAMFTNTNFIHFDLPSIPDPGAPNFDLDDDAAADEAIKYEDLLAGTTSPSDLIDPSIDTSHPAPVPFYPTYNTPIQPAPSANGFRVNPQPPSSSVTPSSASPPSQQPSKKRKADAAAAPSPAVSAEEQSRLAAEEDKRRRNTAASARFRVKKKQREVALERTVKEINDKNAELQAKVNRLEMENKWLKDLVVDQNSKQSKEEIAEAFQQFRRESEERETTTRGTEVKKGVGTALLS